MDFTPFGLASVLFYIRFTEYHFSVGVWVCLLTNKLFYCFPSCCCLLLSMSKHAHA